MSIASEIARMMGAAGGGSKHMATVLRTDQDGTVWVSIPGGVEETFLTGTNVDLQPGDLVEVTIADGLATATGNVSAPSIGRRTVDSAVQPLAEAVEVARRDSQLAAEMAQEAEAVASATDQHFWSRSTDPDQDGAGTGAFVTDDEQDAFLAAAAQGFPDIGDGTEGTKPWHNILMNSLGILLRSGLYDLAALTRSGIAFYDGEGNEAGNMLALFGKDGAQIGKDGESNVQLDHHNFMLVDKYGQVVARFGTDAVVGLDTSGHTLMNGNGLAVYDGADRMLFVGNDLDISGIMLGKMAGVDLPSMKPVGYVAYPLESDEMDGGMHYKVTYPEAGREYVYYRQDEEDPWSDWGEYYPGTKTYINMIGGTPGRVYENVERTYAESVEGGECHWTYKLFYEDDSLEVTLVDASGVAPSSRVTGALLSIFTDEIDSVAKDVVEFGGENPGPLAPWTVDNYLNPGTYSQEEPDEVRFTSGENNPVTVYPRGVWMQYAEVNHDAIVRGNAAVVGDVCSSSVSSKAQMLLETYVADSSKAAKTTITTDAGSLSNFIHIDAASGSSVEVGTDADNGNAYVGAVQLRDKNGYWMGRYGSRTTGGSNYAFIGARNRKADGTDVTNYINLIVDKDGSTRYGMTNPAAFRSALALGEMPTPVSKTTSVASGSNVNVASMSLSAGTWMVCAKVQFPSNATGRRAVKLSTTSADSTNVVSTNVQTAVSGATMQMSTSRCFKLTATTNVYLIAWQNSGTALSCVGDLEATRIG